MNVEIKDKKLLELYTKGKGVQKYQKGIPEAFTAVIATM